MIGKRIKEQRTKLNITLEELGRKAGVNKATIHRYESGVISNIPSDKIELLAKALRVSPAYLMGWTDEQDSNEVKFQIKKSRINKIIEMELDEGSTLKAFGITKSDLDDTSSEYIPIKYTKLHQISYELDIDIKYLIGTSDIPYPQFGTFFSEKPTIKDEKPLTLIAAHALKDLNDEEIQEVLQFIKFQKMKREENNGK